MSERRYTITADEAYKLHSIASYPDEWIDDETNAWLKAHEYRERTCHIVCAKRPNGAEGLGIFGICSECGGKMETVDMFSQEFEKADAFCRTCGAKVVKQ